MFCLSRSNSVPGVTGAHGQTGHRVMNPTVVLLMQQEERKKEREGGRLKGSMSAPQLLLICFDQESEVLMKPGMRRTRMLFVDCTSSELFPQSVLKPHLKQS